MENQPTEDAMEKLNPRNYQLELYEISRRENTIVYLQTGSGKTLIAVLLIRDLAAEVTTRLAEGGRRIVFLVPTVILAQQQAGYIRRHTCLKVGEYYGSLGVDLWKGDKWKEEFETNNVLVMTAQLFVNAVNHSFILTSQIRLLVIDECHRAVKDSPMKQAMTVINEAREIHGAGKVPRILGLTAALFVEKCKPRDVPKIIRQLESTMNSRIRTANDYKEALRSSTKPIEIICEYANCWSSNADSEAEWLSSHIQELMEGTLMDLNNSALHETKDPATETLKELTDILKEITVMTNIFGPYGTHHAVSLFAREINRLEFESARSIKSEQKRIFQLVATVLKDIKQLCEFIFRNQDERDRLRLFISPHVARLLDILRQFRSREGTGNVPLCSIVFVERRSSANVLYHILRAASECDPDLSYLSPLFTIGQASGNPRTKMKENQYLGTNQAQIIRRFRDGSCNLLVATSVLEEGVDVRACNLVVRFDGIKTYCDYIQSKGRARSPNAIYVLMVPQRDVNTFLDTLAAFHSIEQSLLDPSSLQMSNVADDESVDSQLDRFWQSTIPPYRPNPNGAQITLLSSIGLLNWYCATLPSDGTAVLTPYWQVNEISRENLKDVDSRHHQHLTGSIIGRLFQCTLLLPLNSPVREEIIGRVIPSKRIAKQDAALKACIRLHQLGELDDQHLLPLSKSVVKDVVEMEDIDCSEADTSDNYYVRGVARIFVGGLVPPYYLYLIHFEMANPSNVSQPENWFDASQHVQHRLGFLSSEKLPSLNPFGLFCPIGQVNVKFIEIASELRLKDDDIQLCHRFQEHIFENIIELTKEDRYNQSTCSYLIVPVNLGSMEIDLTFINNQLNQEEWQDPSISKQNSGYDIYNDKVVIALHRANQPENKSKRNHYYVETVRHDLTPKSKFPNPLYSTYFHYYRNRFETPIKDLSQPLLEVSKESFKSFNFLTPKYVNRKGGTESDKKPTRGRIHLVPELCLVHRFPASLWRQTIWIPSIFYRLNSLLLAEELRTEIWANTELGSTSSDEQWEPLWLRFHSPASKPELMSSAVDKSNDDDSIMKILPDIDMEIEKPVSDLRNSMWNVDLHATEINTNLQGRIIPVKNKSLPNNQLDHKAFEFNFDDRSLYSPAEHPIGPSPGHILQALTTSVNVAGFDLERLEVIGDSFLKLATSIRVYCEAPSHFHEGKMTHLRMLQVSNDNLFKLGKKKSLPKSMTATKFAPKENWLPPCYFPNDPAQYEPQEKPDLRIWQKITRKSVADSVEALFGLYLTHHGIKGALKVMRWMGVDVPDAGQGVSCFGGTPPSPVLVDSPEAAHFLDDQLAGFDALERDIKYKFRNRFYLLQAFSHASYCHNRLTSCYQRLEFLGDAVFDYLITKFLYEYSGHELTPGALSDMRSALVNNVTFAVLSVRNGFHRFLKHMVPDTHHAIDRFVQQQELECDHDATSEESFFLIGTKEDPIAEDIDVPKVLGDIFESLVGAVFLDSDMSLDAVWRVFYPLIRSKIDACTRVVPKSPIRMLHESFPGLVKFRAMENLPDGRICLAVEIENHGRLYKGVGRNSRIAKNTAAKHALKQLGLSKTFAF